MLPPPWPGSPPQEANWVHREKPFQIDLDVFDNDEREDGRLREGP